MFTHIDVRIVEEIKLICSAQINLSMTLKTLSNDMIDGRERDFSWILFFFEKLRTS